MKRQEDELASILSLFPSFSKSSSSLSLRNGATGTGTAIKSVRKRKSNSIDNELKCEKILLPEHQISDALKWVKKFDQAVDFVSSKGVLEALQDPANNGLIRLQNFLPNRVARGLLALLKDKPASDWLASSSDIDAAMYDAKTGAGSTLHAFAASEGVLVDPSCIEGKKFHETTNDDLMECFLHILTIGILKNDATEKLGVFQCGRYTHGNYIEPHDDSAYKDVGGVIYSRDIAIVLYLSKHWIVDFGGLFVDHGVFPSLPIVPEFNSLVAFYVPRMHEVTPIIESCSKKRFSVFGWILQKGQNYTIKVLLQHK
jgi:hypothetical protein